MPSVEERLAYLEGRIEEHTHAMNGFRDGVRQINHRMDGLSGRIDGLSARVDALDRKLDARFDNLDQKVSRTFLWVVGVQMTILLAVIGALIRT